MVLNHCVLYIIEICPCGCISETYDERQSNVGVDGITGLYGIGRAVSLTDPEIMSYSDSLSVISYNGAYNGGTQTFTKPGVQTTLVYSAEHMASQQEAAQDIMVYSPPQVKYNGSYLDLAIPISCSGRDFVTADQNGAQYFGIQWTEIGKVYAAELTDFLISNESGYDLGVQFSRSWPQFTSEHSAQRYGNAGGTITIKPETKTGYKFVGFVAVYAGGVNERLAVTDNGDGTYSFTMPEKDIKVI